MSPHNDPFAKNDPRWTPYVPPDDSELFAMPDLTASTLKSWLRSDECADEMGLQPEHLKPARPVVCFVDTPHGLQLHITRGEVTKIYSGPESELGKIARAANGG